MESLLRVLLFAFIPLYPIWLATSLLEGLRSGEKRWGKLLIPLLPYLFLLFLMVALPGTSKEQRDWVFFSLLISNLAGLGLALVQIFPRLSRPSGMLSWWNKAVFFVFSLSVLANLLVFATKVWKIFL